MTTEEKQVIINVGTWCINRIRQEHGRVKPDYATAAGDVESKLQFFLDWTRVHKVFSQEQLVRELGPEARVDVNTTSS